MRKRTKSRELALQMLYELDIKGEELGSIREEFWKRSFEDESPPKEVRIFSEELANGVLDNKDELDKAITIYAQNWQLKRMAVIDRNIIRMGCFELLFRDDIPPKVSINEAVELAKKYGDIPNVVQGLWAGH